MLSKIAQAKRRKTLFPMPGRDLHFAKACAALRLDALGYTAREIRQIMNLSGPDQARGLVAKGRRL